MAIGAKMTDGIALKKHAIVVRVERGGDRRMKHYPRVAGEADSVSRRKGQTYKAEFYDEIFSRERAEKAQVARTIGEAIEYYYTTDHWNDLSTGTKIRNARHIRAFQRWCLAEAKIDLISALDLALVKKYQSWYSLTHRKLRKGFADNGIKEHYEVFPRGVNNNMSAVRNVFTEEMMRPDRQLSVNPFRPAARVDGIDGIEKLNMRHNTKRPFTPREWDLFLNEGLLCAWRPEDERAVKHRHIFLILYYTLIRSSELRYMEQSWIAPDFSTITVPYFMTKTGPKTGKDNVVNCHPELRPHLEYFLRRNEGKKYLIEGDEVVKPNYFQSTLRAACARLEKKYPGMDFSKIDVHSVRRTGATFLYHHGAALGSISRMLNHSSVATTLIYLGIVDDRRVIEDLKLLPKSETKTGDHPKTISSIAV